MTSRPPQRRSRKQPDVRRAEIVDAAAELALAEGLECLTLRNVGEKLGIRASTVGHYFPAAEDLVAETFGTVAESELSALIPTDTGETPKEQLTRFLELALSARFHDVNRLWLNARHLARYRPALRDRVILQGDRWRDRLTQLISDGVVAGEFRTEDPVAAALKILAVVDGLSADLNADPRFPPAVMRMLVDVAEDELGQPPGGLR